MAAAVKVLQRADNVPQLVLSDLRMPDHDGLYLLQWMHAHAIHLPFIIMTSYAEVQNAVEAMKLGATDYIAKPVQPDLLLQKIDEALKASSARPWCLSRPCRPKRQARSLPEVRRLQLMHRSPIRALRDIPRGARSLSPGFSGGSHADVGLDHWSERYG